MSDMNRRSEDAEKKEGKLFIGAYISPELKELLKIDAKNEHRTVSGQLEHLLVIALKFRGYDMTDLLGNVEQNTDLQRMMKLVRKEISADSDNQ